MHIIIYCRLNSYRFKNKPIYELINKKSLIEEVIVQAKKIVKSKKIILATTKKKEDYKLCKIAKKYKINYYKGSEKNVALRTYEICKKFKVDYFFRYCADRPFLNINLLKKSSNIINKKKFDLITTNLNKKIDQGLTLEIINAKSFVKLFNKYNFNPSEKEHITKIFYKLKKSLKIKQISFNKIYSKGYRYTIDYRTDVNVVNFILKNKKFIKTRFYKIVYLYEKYFNIN